MSVSKAITVIASMAVVCSAIGTGLGFCIGRFAPSAYFALFRYPPNLRSDIDPIEVGVALGIAQGLIVGAVLGVVVVALVTWYEIRTAGRQEPRQ